MTVRVLGYPFVGVMQEKEIPDIGGYGKGGEGKAEEMQMKYIDDVKPPLSRDQIEAIIRDIEPTQTRIIDGIVLSRLIYLCYRCGLKKKELIDMTIGDLFIGDTVRDALVNRQDESDHDK